MHRIISTKALKVNGYATFFNMGRIFNALFLCNSLNKDAILSDILRNWLVIEIAEGIK